MKETLGLIGVALMIFALAFECGNHVGRREQRAAASNECVVSKDYAEKLAVHWRKALEECHAETQKCVDGRESRR